MTTVSIPNSVTSIGPNAFAYCDNLQTVTIGKSVSTIENGAFAYCPNITHVTCFADKVPSTDTEAFNNSSCSNATLFAYHTRQYEVNNPWSTFGNYEWIDKCATPTIAFENGRISFSCNTEGAKYQYSLHTFGESAGSVDIPSSYLVKVTAYATAEGYAPSEDVTKTIVIDHKYGDVDGSGEVNIGDITKIIDVLLVR